MLRPLIKTLAGQARRFARSHDGGLSVEAIMVFPILAWAYMGMYFFFDAYRQQNVNLKAAYTISDLLSREVDVIDWTYLNGVQTFFDYLTTSSQDTKIRVSSVYWDADVNKHILVWSKGTRNLEDLTQEQIENLYADEIPVMADKDTVILVETWSYFDPVVKVGLPSVTFDNLIVTSLRFAPQLCFEVCGVIGSGTVHDDGTNDGAEEEPAT